MTRPKPTPDSLASWTEAWTAIEDSTPGDLETHRHVAATFPVAVARFGPDGALRWTTPMGSSLGLRVGVTRIEDLRARSAGDLDASIIVDALAAGERIQGTSSWVGANGRRVLVHIAAQPVLHEGQPDGAVLVAIDRPIQRAAGTQREVDLDTCVDAALDRGRVLLGDVQKGLIVDRPPHLSGVPTGDAGAFVDAATALIGLCVTAPSLRNAMVRVGLAGPGGRGYCLRMTVGLPDGLADAEALKTLQDSATLAGASLTIEAGHRNYVMLRLETPVSTRPQAPTIDPMLAGRHALIILDHPVSRHTAVRALQSAGMHTSEGRDLHVADELCSAARDRHHPVSFLLAEGPIPGETLDRLTAANGAPFRGVWVLGTPSSDAKDPRITGYIPGPDSPRRIRLALTCGRTKVPAIMLGGQRPTAVGGRVLLADSNTARGLRRCDDLADLGYIPELVADGREAVMAAARGGYAALIVEANAPVLNAIEAAQAVRDSEPVGQRLAIISLVSGVPDAHPPAEAAENAVDATVALDSPMDQLGSVLQQLIGSPHRHH